MRSRGSDLALGLHDTIKKWAAEAAAVRGADSAEVGTELIVLGMFGSFYPLHAGHVEVLLAAKRHIEQCRGATVIALLAIPTAYGSLRSKFDGLEEEHDTRTAVAGALLSLLRHGGDGDSSGAPTPSVARGGGGGVIIRWLPALIGRNRRGGAAGDWLVDCPEIAAGVGEMSRLMKRECEAAGARFVQACGTDNQIRAALRGRTTGEVYVVVDARGIPPENMEVANDCDAKGVLVHAPLHGTAMSSTIERFLAPPNAFPRCSVPSQMKTDWLTDTGLTLGAGRQAFVRLMFLGTFPVAVKVLRRGGRFDTFDVESVLWAEMASSGSKITPDLIGIGTTPDNAFAYLVTHVGVPLTKLLKINYEYDWDPAGTVSVTSGDDPCSPALSAFGIGHGATLPVDATGDVRKDAVHEACDLNSITEPLPSRIAMRRLALVRPAVEAAFERQWSGDWRSGGDEATCADLARRCTAVEQLRTAVGALRNAGIIHRDLKVDNMLVMPDGTLRIVDFGVAKHCGDSRQIARGNLRQYPPRALKERHWYDFTADEYFATQSAYEIMVGDPVFAEYRSDTQKVIAAKLAGATPEWPERLLVFARDGSSLPAGDRRGGLSRRVAAIIDWANSVWERDQC